MLKALAVLRTIFLVAIAGYTAWSMPWTTFVSQPIDVQYAQCSATLGRMVWAAWIAIAWIALETLIGWAMSSWQARKRPIGGAPPPRTAEPPFAPPPRH